MGSTTPLPYWQINIPSQDRTPHCPPYLQNLSPKDLSIISTPDAFYLPLSWPTVRSISASNRLDAFQRLPSDLRRYLAFMYTLKQKHGSVMKFILEERLQWGEGEREAKGRGLFEEESDWKVLWNDWPYGIDGRIVHLVVWTKFALVEGPDGDLTAEARREVEEWVEKVFGRRVGGENVIWFKNWKSLKSVHAVEHFHVMLFDPDPEFVKEVTNGDVPLCKKLLTV
ncbi:uncharacterized protein LY89DRAFT_664550 [Mollisia scopiformis]|uniref:N-acetylglucosamine-induced protein 1 n=1 Tax=Mollisia scopiformis TaxID=149040 RepID=A0A194XRS8_MOLSC|nr:uncharacterized protein LY89DRAFT_664550 [Mollisia scopiformis]KUJ22754.1 hypothetical protein LY89DRAFT_664550 [Mollisia scopiformis]